MDERTRSQGEECGWRRSVEMGERKEINTRKCWVAIRHGYGLALSLVALACSFYDLSFSLYCRITNCILKLGLYRTLLTTHSNGQAALH